MLFEDNELASRKKSSLHMLPEVPETGWIKPTFPDIRDAAFIGIDTETYDPELTKYGPGWGRGIGHIVGISLAAVSHNGHVGKWYYPIRHEVEPHDNMPVGDVIAYVKLMLETPHIPKVGANLIYDYGWLMTEGIRPMGTLHDVQFAEALLDAEANVGLDDLARKYLNETKTTDAMYDWLREAYPFTPLKETRGNIYRSPPSLAGPYAEDDALLPINIMKRQRGLIEAEGLGTVYALENRLIPLLVDMRMQGVAVDIAGAEMLYDEMQGELAESYKRFKTEFGYGISSVGSPDQLKALFAHLDIQTPLTEAGNPSIQKEWLATHEHPVAKLVNDVRQREKLCGTFIKSYIMDKHVPIKGVNAVGKIYPQFHPLKGERNGTLVGRFASSDPNLQNIPSRSALGKRVRQLFIPDPGHDHWRKLDYSQIHYRILAHYAVGKGSDELRASYINNPKMDYHQNVKDRVLQLTGMDIQRSYIKNINFGLLYGQSEKRLAYTAGFTEKQAQETFAAYFAGAPYVKPTMENIGKEVQKYGYVTTVLGRRVRFTKWEPVSGGYGEQPLNYHAAVAKWGHDIRRAFEYRGVNYKFQGSEPDIMKTGMVNCYESGLYNETGVPRLTVHDETDYSVADDSKRTQEAFREIQLTMESAVKMRVPMFADMEKGPNWGQVEEITA